jgi:glycosyltransferase involved in cell wall biosynthesis
VTFSIITIVYNGASLIEGTMQSVLNQTFTDFEYLIIDGASKDETMAIVEKYVEKQPLPTISGQVSIKAFSERDKGLYDAMNKGLKHAKGNFVLFLNCGDRFFDNKTLENIAACITPTTDVLYGETMLIDDARKHIGTRTALTVQKLPKTLTWRSLKFGMVVCHQSFLVKRTIAPKYIENNLAADIDWVIKCLKKAENVVNTNIFISEYLMGGISKQRHQQSLKDRYAVLKTHYGIIPNFLNHIIITLRAVWFKIGNFQKQTY